MADALTSRGRAITILVATLAALPAYTYCELHHICMAGHGKHPPYPTWEIVSDFVYIALLATAFVAATRVHTPTRTWLAWPLLFLLLHPTVMGGRFAPLDAIVILCVVVSSIRLVVGSCRGVRSRNSSSLEGNEAT